MIRAYSHLVLSNLRARKLRNSLTILGIVIGIAAIITLITITQSLEYSVTKQFEKIGTNRMYVMAKGGSIFQAGDGLTDKDVETLEGIGEVEWVNAYLTQSASGELNHKTEQLTVWGATREDLAEQWKAMDMTLKEGRYPQINEQSTIVIGYDVATKIFDRIVPLNSMLHINNEKFRVIGILNQVGNPDDDAIIYMDFKKAQELFKRENDVSFIELVVKTGFAIEPIAKKAEKILRKTRDIASHETADFEVVTPDQLLGQMQSVLLVIQIVLIAIAAISLIVGAIGIANSMFTSVLERTRDIGVMKAIGATKKTIVMLFMMEAGVIGIIGGVCGTLIGLIAAYSIGIAIASAGYAFFSIYLNPVLFILGILFGGVIGVIASIFPASRAAKAHPVEALRA